ncbi:hypothetical protein [Pseudomonas sp. SWRI92]|uniref:hypothetical protein n=1 Tax=Pseudomonas sp. SWRI92 TaxID=2745499 RepID=UPI001EE227D4|nr:hypothetical protein [Pseudomonas sp. SWRI92]
MHSHENKVSLRQFVPFCGERADEQNEGKSCSNPAGGTDLEPRVVELETHLKYIRRDMDEIRTDVKAVRHRLAYMAGAAAVVIGLLGWVANNRFDQLVTLLSR